MKVMEVIKHSHHKVKSDADQFRRNMGIHYYSGERSQPKSKLIDKIGSGAYSVAIANKKDPTNVMKISRGTNDLNDDPYYGYLSGIAAHSEMEKNPFIPKVFEVKVYETTGNYKYFYIAKMERLYELRSLNDDELRQFIITLTKPRMMNRIKASVGMYDAVEALKKENHGHLVEILVDKIRREKIKDPQLQAAMRLAQNTGFEYDITANNIMVRKTPNGPQLVLADPVRN